VLFLLALLTHSSLCSLLTAAHNSCFEQSKGSSPISSAEHIIVLFLVSIEGKEIQKEMSALVSAVSPKPEDIEVRFADQEQINEFGRLNNRLLEVRAELKQSNDDNEKLDDASAELLMASSAGNGKIMLLIGESFIECNEDEATECTYNRQYHHLMLFQIA
jgi:hypothetical protein